MHQSILQFGWDDNWELSAAPFLSKGWESARVISRQLRQYTLATAAGRQSATLSGRFVHGAHPDELPVTGDWVMVQRKGADLVMQALLPRRSCFARKPAISGGRKLKHGRVEGGSTVAQVLAANIDVAFLVSSLDGNFNVGRIERYLTVTAGSGAAPVLLLNKADLCDDPQSAIGQLARIVPDVPVHMLSMKTGQGLDALQTWLRPGATVVFLGSSGVGKSTIINGLFGEQRQTTGEVNAAHGKGRHTTTRAELLRHDSGVLLIDTPGLRELQLWCEEDAVEDVFADITALVSQCRFHDCSHRTEPGCAIRQALREGRLTPERLESFRRLDDEVRRLEARKKQYAIAVGHREKQRPRD